MASRLLPVVARGDVYQQVEWVLLDAHSLLLQHRLRTQPHSVEAIAVSCERLSALMRCVSLSVTDDLLQLQLKVSLDIRLMLIVHGHLYEFNYYNVSYILCLKCCGTKIQIHLTTTDLKVYVKITCRKFRS